MTIRTLAEAAAEILSGSKSSAPADPAKKVEGEVVDLGGATHTQPDGGEVGKKAAAAATKMPARLADKPVAAEPSPGAVKEEEETSDEIISEEELDEFLNSLTEEELAALEAKLDEEDAAEGEVELTEEEVAAALAEAREQKVAMIKEKMKTIGIEEDMNALFNGEDLSEDFRNKAATIFESAVIARAIMVVEQLEAEILQAAEDSVEEIKTELEESVNDYMSYVVEDWKKENQVAIQSGLRTEIVEDFISGLRNLFVENYIDIPEDKVSVVEELSTEVESLKEQLNAALNTNIEMKKSIAESNKKEILLSVCEGLTATQVEKMKTLAEGVEFTADGEYREKLEVIKESYFSKKVDTDQATLIETMNEEVPEESSEITSAVMAQYVQAISRTLTK
jgi:hypothetical protein